MQAHVRLEHALVALETQHRVHAMLELEAPQAEADHARPPLRLALVLDRSGSMAGPKLAAACGCADWLAGRLGADDELALIDYDDTVRLRVPRAPGSARAVPSALAGVWPGGSTNLSGGWLKGLEQLRDAPADARRTILLLTDGLANVGIVDRPTLAGMAASARGDGVATTTIGFGAGFDEDLLTAMADAGGGNAYWAQSPDEAPAIFAAELGALATLVAQNVSVEIRPAASVELLAVLNGYPQLAVPGGVQIQLGDAYGGERRRLVFELLIPDLAALGPAVVTELVVRYVAVAGGVREHTMTVPVVVNAVSAEEAAKALPDAAVREQVMILRAAGARDEATKLLDRGDTAAAAALLRFTAEELRAANALAPGLDAEALALEQLGSSMTAAAPPPPEVTRKTLRYDARQARRGGGRRNP
jgi:Ca-activated chloride channel family protein